MIVEVLPNTLSGRVIEFCATLDSSQHWAAKAFDTQSGKKIIDAMVEHAKKRQSNAKLLAQLEDAIRELLGSVLFRCVRAGCAQCLCFDDFDFFFFYVVLSLLFFFYNFMTV